MIKEEICSSSKCMACGACVNICPQKCITFKIDEYGEQHPFINQNKCLNCNLCRNVCPNLKKVDFYLPKDCLAGWRKDKEKRMDSSSGGIATLLSEDCIKRSGVVYGVKYERDKGAFFTMIDNNINDLDKIKGSKYVQAEIGDTYKNIINDLRSGKEVLFLGMPCQVAGLNSVIKVQRDGKLLSEKLCTVDFLCHGVVPAKYLEEEIGYLEKKYGFHCDSISFRSNDKSKNYYLSLFEESKLKYCKKAEYQRYFYGFLNSITIRESCLNCLYKTKERVGDITLGDFIGIGRKEKFEVSSEVMINPSLILINTVKGKNVLDFSKKDISMWKRSLDEAIDGGPSLRGNMKQSKTRLKFRDVYLKKGYIKSFNQTVLLKMIIKNMNNISKIYIRKVKKLLFK